MINPGGSILWWWSAVDSHYTALLNITVTLLNTDSHDCSLHLHAVSVNTLLLIKLQKMVQFPGRMKPLLSTSVCRQQLWEETRRTDIRRGAPSIIYANIVNRNKLKNHFLCHAFLSNFLPPPQISFFLPLCDSLSFSEHVFLSASGLCSCAHSSQSLLCIYSFFLIINFSLSLSLSLHGGEPLIGPFGPRLPSRLCLCRNPAAFHWMPAAEGNKTGGRGGGERLDMEGERWQKHWDEWCMKDEQRNVFIATYHEPVDFYVRTFKCRLNELQPEQNHISYSAHFHVSRRRRRTDKHRQMCPVVSTTPAFYLSYLAVVTGGVHAVIALHSAHAELTLVGGTVHHSGWSQNSLHQQQHHQNQQQDVIGLLDHTHTHTKRTFRGF